MTTEKQTVHRLYTSGSADFLDSEGDVRPMADLDDSMEFADETFPPLVAGQITVRAVKRSVLTRRRNTRGGRAYREPSDSDLDPYWNDSRALALSDEQKAINRAGIARVRDVLRESNRTTE